MLVSLLLSSWKILSEFFGRVAKDLLYWVWIGKTFRQEKGYFLFRATFLKTQNPSAQPGDIEQEEGGVLVRNMPKSVVQSPFSLRFG